LSIPAIRAVAIGEGFGAASVKGTAFHDPFVVDARKRVVRTSNRAGGIEGGMTNGETVVVSAVMKPIPSVVASLPSVDLTTGEPVAAAYERSDVCAVPAASVAGEAMAALVMADALLEAVGDVPWTRFLSAVEALRARRRRL
jgi:chorismate synthase